MEVIVLDDAHVLRSDEAETLTRHFGIFLCGGQGMPGIENVAFGDWAVGLGETIDVYGHYVERFHAFEEGGGRW